MIHDLLLDRPEPNDVADVCIVGAGAAGIVLAVELARRNLKVLLLEGGGHDVEEASQEPYRSEVVGLPHRGVHTGRFRAEGGTTNRWGGQILEFDERDFEPREGIEQSGWPFPKAQLAPYYKRALALEGLEAVTRSDEAVWRQIGLESPNFTGLEPYLSRWCPEPKFARLHHRTLAEDPGLHLWLHANAVEPILEGDAIRGLRCRTLTGIEATFRANRFVFCLGAIESSRFFLQPLSGRTPWNRSALLGRQFQDHIDANVAVVEPIERREFHGMFDNIFVRGFKYHPKTRLAGALQRQHRTLNVAASMVFVSDADEALGRLKTTAKKILRGRFAETHPSELLFAARNLSLVGRQAVRHGLHHRVYNPPDARILLRVHCEQEPTSKSSITLSEERDSLGLFRTRLDWQISERELDSIRLCALAASESLAKVARLTVDPELLAANPAYRRHCDDSNHHMGGMRMSQSPETGVVDTDLALYGLKNTYICSSAVFPTSGFSNPTHTLLALTVRLGDHLVSRIEGETV